MKKLLIILFLFCSVQLWAVNHTVGTGGTFTTIAQVNAHTFVAGDSILFKRGETFTGTITVGQSGSISNTIVYGAWGASNLAQPIITGFVSVTAWTDLGNNIWESTNVVSTLSTLNMVTIGGINTPMGRFPKSGYYFYESHSGTTQITSSDLTGTPNWTGAELAFNNSDWTTKRCPITNQSAGTLTFTNPESLTIYEDNQKFIIQNDVRTLTQQNDWYYNPSTKKLRIYSTSQPSDVQVTTIDNLVSVTSKSYITFDNISFTGANSNAFSLGAASNITVQNCTIDFSGHSGIYGSYAGSSPNLTVKNCIIDHSNNGGIGVTNLFTNAVIQSNTVNNTGMIYGASAILISGTNSSGIANAISVPGAGSLIEYNIIENTGYDGIWFYGTNSIVRNNFINKYCQINHDGGGIYTYNSNNATCTGTRVYDNVVINSVTTAVYRVSHNQMDAGIYCDGSTNGVEIYNNTVSSPDDYGLFLNGGHDINMHDNTVFDCAYGLRIYHAVTNVTSTANILVAKTATKFPLLLDPAETIIAGIIFDSNYYARPIDDNTTIRCIIRTPSVVTSDKTLAQWETYSSQDATSHKSPFAVNSVNNILFDYNETLVNKTVTGLVGYKSLDNVSVTSYTLTPYTSIILLYDGILPTYNPVLHGNYKSVNNKGKKVKYQGKIVKY